MTENESKGENEKQGDEDAELEELDRVRQRFAGSPARQKEAALDAELVMRWQKENDQRAADALLVRYYKLLRRFFLNKVPRDTVEDLVQETFLQCLGALKTFEGRSSLRTFITLIAKRRCWKYYRTRGRKFDRLDPLEGSVQAMSTGVFTKLARRLDQRILLEALRRIPLKYQTVLELFYWEELTGKEVAEILEMNPSTVKTWLRVGKQRLQEQLVAGGWTAGEQHQSTRALESMKASIQPGEMGDADAV